jgi:hypothetical protein
MKNQKYLIFIEDKLPTKQVLKLWKLAGLEIKSERGKSDCLHGVKDSFFLWENGILTFHSGVKLKLSSKDLIQQISRLDNQKVSIKKQPFAKALGLKNRDENCWILDGTVGLAKDYFLARSFGFNVLGLECSSLCYSLLGTTVNQYDLKSSSCILNLETSEFLEKFVQNGMSIEEDLHKKEVFESLTDSNLTYCKSLFEKVSESAPSVVYLDPMYDEGNMNALPSKQMQILRHELDIQTERSIEKLFRRSYELAKNRVVLKRSVKSSIKFKDLYSFSSAGKSTRYDVYLKV